MSEAIHIHAHQMPTRAVRARAWRWLLFAAASVAGLSILLFASAALAFWNGDREYVANKARYRAESIAEAAEGFAIEKGRLPVTLEELTPKYIYELPQDPWHAKYIYEQAPGGFQIVSLGSKHRRDGPDAIAVSGSFPPPESQPASGSAR